MPQATIDNIVCHYRMSKRAPADGCAIICIHGSGASSIVWSYQISRLSKYFKIIAPDLPGHGESGGSALSSAEAYARWVGRFSEELRLPALYLFGHSFGGAIVQEYARLYPKKIKGLVLVGCGTRFILSGIYRLLYEKGLDPARPMHAAQIPESFRKEYELLCAVSNQALHDDLIAAGAFDSSSWIGSVQAPCLVVWGSNDTITPVESPRGLAAGLPHATLEIIQNAGHVVMVDKPEDYNSAAIKFLAANGEPVPAS